MVSHDCVAFYLLSEEVAKSVKVVQSGQGADEVFAGYDWYPPLAEVPRDRRRRRLRAACSSTARTTTWRTSLAPEWLLRDDPSRAVRHRALRRAGRRRHALDAALRLDTDGHAGRRPGQAGRQHDDGLGPGGPGAVPRPRAGRAGRRLPARAEARRTAARACSRRPPRGVVPDEVIDRHQGLLPGARHPPPRGPVPRTRARRAVEAPVAQGPRPVPPRLVSTRCSPTPTPSARTSARTRCGRWHCWRCGCRSRGWDERTRACADLRS